MNHSHRFVTELLVRFLLGSNFLEYHEVLMRHFGCYVHVFRFNRHEICFPILDLVQAIQSVTSSNACYVKFAF